jgi:O-antigen ligase
VLFPVQAGRDALEITSTYSYGVFRPFFREHGTYSAYLSMLLPAALLAGMDRARRWRILYGVCAIVIALGILLAFARAGWLATLVVVPGAVWMWARWGPGLGRGLLLPGLIAAALCVLVAGVGISRQVTRHAGTVVSAENLSNIERYNRWSAAIEMTRARPLTGVGYGCYLDAYPQYKRRALGTDQSTIRMGTHSEPLKLLSELGIPGFLAALWLVFAIVKLGVACIRFLPDPGDRLAALAALAGLSTYLVNGFFNSYLVEDKVTVPFWMAIGVIAALGRRLPARA